MARFIDGNIITDTDLQNLYKMHMHAVAYKALYDKLSDGCKAHIQDAHTLTTNINYLARWLDQNTKEVIIDIVNKSDGAPNETDGSIFSQREISALLEEGDGCKIEDFINNLSCTAPCCYLENGVWLIDGDRYDEKDIHEYLTKQPEYCHG